MQPPGYAPAPCYLVLLPRPPPPRGALPLGGRDDVSALEMAEALEAAGERARHLRTLHEKTLG